MKKSDESTKFSTDSKHKHNDEKKLKDDKIFGSSPSHKLVFPKKDKVKIDDNEPVVKKDDDKKEKKPKDNNDEKTHKTDEVDTKKEKVTEKEKIAQDNQKQFKKAIEKINKIGGLNKKEDESKKENVCKAKSAS